MCVLRVVTMHGPAPHLPCPCCFDGIEPPRRPPLRSLTLCASPVLPTRPLSPIVRSGACHGQQQPWPVDWAPCHRCSPYCAWLSLRLEMSRRPPRLPPPAHARLAHGSRSRAGVGPPSLHPPASMAMPPWTTTAWAAATTGCARPPWSSHATSSSPTCRQTAGKRESEHLLCSDSR